MTIQEWRKANSEKVKAQARKWKKANRERYNKNNCIWANNNREKVRLSNNKWHKNNTFKVVIINLKGKINRGLRITKFGQEGIKEFYDNCPVGFVVDHIIPLCGKQVSGLHVINNLQYLTKHENVVKHNSFDGTNKNTSWRDHL